MANATIQDEAETTLDLAARLRDCSSTTQMTRLVKNSISADPNNGVSNILQAIWKIEGKEGRRLERLWLKWLKA